VIPGDVNLEYGGTPDPRIKSIKLPAKLEQMLEGLSKMAPRIGRGELSSILLAWEYTNVSAAKVVLVIDDFVAKKEFEFLRSLRYGQEIFPNNENLIMTGSVGLLGRLITVEQLDRSCIPELKTDIKGSNRWISDRVLDLLDGF
jgi:hypothetical protein